NVAGITALGASLELLLGVGIPAVGARVLELTDHLCERAARAGLGVYSSRRPWDKSGIVSLVVPGADPRGLVRRCRSEGVVVNNPDKQSFFTLEERVALVRRVVGGLANVEVRPITGLAVRFVREVGARVLLRGLRTLSDMEYEFTMSLTNLAMEPEVETIFLMAKE